jgi:hypothetical protein
MVRVYERRRKRLNEVVSNVLYRNNALPKDERRGVAADLNKMLNAWITEADK